MKVFALIRTLPSNPASFCHNFAVPVYYFQPRSFLQALPQQLPTMTDKSQFEQGEHPRHKNAPANRRLKYISFRAQSSDQPPETARLSEYSRSAASIRANSHRRWRLSEVQSRRQTQRQESFDHRRRFRYWPCLSSAFCHGGCRQLHRLLTT